MEEDLSLASSQASQQSQRREVSKTDVETWWKGFAEVLRNCYTPNRADLEIPLEEAEHFQEWAFSSASQIMSNSDSQCREKVVAFVCGASSGICILMSAMEELSDSGTSKGEAVSKLLRESVNPKNGKNRTLAMKQALDADYLTFSIKVLKDLVYARSRTKTHSVFELIDSTIVNVLWFQSAVASNDSGFASKVREMLKVKFFHHDLFKKMFFGKTSAHYPLLKILRQLSKNSMVSKTLGKEGIMSTIRKVFSVLNNQPCGKLLILMDALSLLTKDKTNCIRFLKAGLIVKLVRCFTHWITWRGRGLLRLSKSMISIYNHIACTKSGRKALVQCDAIVNIRKFCDQCPSERAFDDVIMKAAAMISVCYEKDILPVENVESPIRFEIPESERFRKYNDSGSSSDDEGSESEDGLEVGSDEIVEDDDDSTDDEKSISDDDEDDSRPSLHKDKSKCLPETSCLRSKNENSGESNFARTPSPLTAEELKQYNRFFFELGNEPTSKPYRQRENKRSKDATIEPSVDENSNETTGKPQLLSLRSDHNYLSLDENPEYKYWDSIDDLRREYIVISNELRHVSPFVKIGYPDIAFGYSRKASENILASTDRSVLRNKLLTYISRTAGCDTYKPKELYSLDNLMLKNDKKVEDNLGNSDEKDIGRFNRKTGLEFEARFESGNLRKVIQVGEREFDMLITSDVNSHKHNQWFYFQISNVCDDIPYTFNLINCTKTNSLFNYGMQPVVFSVTDAVKGRPGWIRSGSNICYYKNGYKCLSKKSNRVYHTLSFSLSFCHKGDIVYVAYHIPYTYTRLMVELNAMIKAVENKSTDVLVRYDTLCLSVNKNEVPLLTITSQEQQEHPIKKRKIIILTSRVHPGESNASWMMKGILEFLMFGNPKNDLLKKFVFKIVPMLNVEGVINGCHRCGLTSEDLNRCWKFPSSIQHPTIYHSKMLIEYCKRVLNRSPVIYCDLHGHSRRKNVFFYGCSFTKSWNVKDKLETEDPQFIRSLPENMDRVASAFCLSYCNYDVRKSRETTARVAVWRDYEIMRSYTLECSYSGCDRGPYKGTAFGTNHLLEVGKNLCEAFATL